MRNNPQRNLVMRVNLPVSAAAFRKEKCLLPPIQCQGSRSSLRRSLPDSPQPMGMKEGILDEPLSLTRFRLLRTIGTGSFARVRLVLDRFSNETVVLKRLSKSLLVKRNGIKLVLSEKTALKKTKSPFVVSLKDTFQDAFYLYFVLEYIQGGELYKLLEINNGPLGHDYAQFCASEVICALSHLHTHDIVYRDLKPENILITSTGHIKLADLGYAKVISSRERTYTFCGTPEYLSPEMIERKGHGFACDWWALGVLIYEMLVGYPPFRADTPFNLYEKIVTEEVSFPSDLSPEPRSLIFNLLIKDPQSRATEEQVRSHPYFAGVSWEDVEKLRIQPQYRPKVKDMLDTSNFDKYEEKDLAIDERKPTDPNLFRYF